jgi:hypothetical protein
MTLKPLRAFFVMTVSFLVSFQTMAAATPSTSNSSVTQAQKPVSTAASFSLGLDMTRSTSLIDHQDGSRSDAMDYSVKPAVKLSFGSLSSEISYTQNLRDETTPTENDFSDIPVRLSFIPTKLNLLNNYNSRIGYSITALAPVSKNSTQRDQLQTAISAGLSFAMDPLDGQGLSLATAVSLGRNVHAYEENINGQVLNQYSSNQSIVIGYGLSDWSLSGTFINRSRLTYQGNTKSSFEIVEELGYSLNDNFALALGHTNSGASLKPNGTDSNVEIYNENSSVVYATLSMTF